MEPFDLKSPVYNLKSGVFLSMLDTFAVFLPHKQLETKQ